MAQGLPPLPKSLRGMLSAGGSSQWKDIEKINQLKNLIKQDMNGNTKMNEQATNNEDIALGDDESDATPKLKSSLTFLRNEMIALRQQDLSLLCQLWTLNENLQELKLAMKDRPSDTISECSSYSGLDLFNVVEEHDYENEMFHSHKYENEIFQDNSKDSKEIEKDDEGLYEAVYVDSTCQNKAQESQV